MLACFISQRAFNAVQNTAKWNVPLCLANKTACSFEEIGRGVEGTGLRRRSVRVLLWAAITWSDNCYLWSGSMLLVPWLRCVWYVRPEIHKAKLVAWEAQCTGQKGQRIMTKKKKSLFLTCSHYRAADHLDLCEINYTTLSCPLPCPYCVFWLSCFHGSGLLWVRCPSRGTEGQLYINIFFFRASSSFNLKETQVIQLWRSRIVQNYLFFLFSQISLSNNRSGLSIGKKSTEMSVFTSSAGSTIKKLSAETCCTENSDIWPGGRWRHSDTFPRVLLHYFFLFIKSHFLIAWWNGNIIRKPAVFRKPLY